jgi:sugar phosphate isomerase/epimerase
MTTSARAPIGLELWTVRTDVNRDLLTALDGVARLGYQSVEFYSTYLNWTLEYAREVRTALDRLGLQCSSTHNGMRAFTAEALPRTVELNHALRSPMAIVASVPPVAHLDGWRTAADSFADVAERLRPHGLKAGYHNNQREWTAIDGELPIEIVASGTPDDFVMQFDVGPAVEHGIDAAAWIRAHAGRVRSIHLRDWNAVTGYNIAFGEGHCPWPAIFEAAESAGVVETYLVENGHSSPDEEWPIAERSLANWRRLRQSSEQAGG